MKKLFCVSLIKTVAKCIVDLMTLKQKLISVSSDASDPSNLDPNEYFIGNRKCAAFLGVHERTIRNYASAGLLKSTHVGRFTCYKKSDVEEAIENVPALNTLYEARLKSNRPERIPAITKSFEKSDSFRFIRISYQGWHCWVCTSAKVIKSPHAIEKLCNAVILAYHKIHPFKIAPTL